MGWYFPLQRVEQVDNHGCGIAAVATVCGTSYQRARAEFFPRRRRFDDDESIHVDSTQMQRVIRKLGFSTVLSSSIKGARCPAILVFSWYGGPAHHAVVWDPWQKRVLDPGWDSFEPKRYLEMWKQSGYAAILVTRRRYT